MAAPNTTARFLVKTAGMTFLAAEVRGEGGDGVMLDPGENIPTDLVGAYQNQPAQLQRREDWSHRAHGRILLGDEDEPDMIKAKLSRVSPPPEFARSDMPCKWDDHQVDAWGAFVKIQNQERLTSGEATALLGTGTRGCGDIVQVLPKPIIISGTKIWSNGQDGNDLNPFLAPGVDQVDCDVGLGFTSVKRAREALQHKRYFVGLIYHAAYKHWVGFCYDRVDKTYISMDTLQGGREHRFRRECAAMRERNATLGLPFDFNAFSLPVSTQPSGWECGPLACWMVTSLVRDLVGIAVKDLGDIVPLKTIQIDGTRINPVNTVALRHRDWLFAPWRDLIHHEQRKIKSLNCITAIQSHMLLNELGVAGGRYMEKQEDDMEMDVELAHNDLVDARGLYASVGLFQREHFATDRGGVQFIKANHVPITTNFNDFRVFPAPDPNGLFPICRSTYASPDPVPLRQLPPRVSQLYQDRGLQVQQHTPKKPSSGPVDEDVVMVDSTTDGE